MQRIYSFQYNLLNHSGPSLVLSKKYKTTHLQLSAECTSKGYMTAQCTSEGAF